MKNYKILTPSEQRNLSEQDRSDYFHLRNNFDSNSSREELLREFMQARYDLFEARLKIEANERHTRLKDIQMELDGLQAVANRLHESERRAILSYVNNIVLMFEYNASTNK